MNYSIMDYAATGVIFPFLVLLGCFILAILISRIFSRRKFPIFAIVSPFLICWLLFLTGMICFADGFLPPVIALFSLNDPVQTTEGAVSSVREASAIPLFYDRGSKALLPAMRITVNDDDYYVLHGDIEPGQWLQLTWISDARVVLSWTESEEASANQSSAVSFGLDAPNQSVPQKNSTAQAVLYGSAILFFTVLSAQYLFGRIISQYLQTKDKQYSSGVIPNRLGILHFAIVTCPLLGILIGWGATGFHGAFLIAILVFAVFLRILILKQTSFLLLEGEELLICEFKTTRALPLEEVKNVSWGTSKIPNNRSLIVQLRSGYTISFEQENYWGLEHMYHQLKRKDQGETTGLR